MYLALFFGLETNINVEHLWTDVRWRSCVMCSMWCFTLCVLWRPLKSTNPEGQYVKHDQDVGGSRPVSGHCQHQLCGSIFHILHLKGGHIIYFLLESGRVSQCFSSLGVHSCLCGLPGKTHNQTKWLWSYAVYLKVHYVVLRETTVSICRACYYDVILWMSLSHWIIKYLVLLQLFFPQHSLLSCIFS